MGISYINHSSVAKQVISIPLGILFAIRKNSLMTKLSSVVNNIGVSVPSFWIGMILIGIFSVKLGIFPTRGMHSTGNDSFSDLLKHIVLSVITISLYNIAVFTNYVQTSVSEQLTKQYVVTARAKGISENVVIFKHILKNLLTSIITILGMSIQRLVTGAFVVEVVFSWPGMGRFMIDSIFSRDYPVIMAITMMSAVFLILGNLIADILYILVDPKVKSSKGGF